MQSDGNLVVYTSVGRSLWGSGTDQLGDSSLVMQSDGNLVIYHAGYPTWARHGGALDCYSRATESLRFPRQRMYVPTHLRGTVHAGGRGLSDSSTFSIG